MINLTVYRPPVIPGKANVNFESDSEDSFDLNLPQSQRINQLKS